MAHPRVLFIGLDAAEPNLLTHWAQSGDLPGLARLARAGATVPIVTADGFSAGCVWPTLFTGVNPGRHGRFSSATWRRGSYDYADDFDEDGDLQAPPFWTSLSDAGVRVGIIDMVRAPLVPNINGYQIADWLTHDRRLATRSFPEGISREFIDQFGHDRVGGQSERFLERFSEAELIEAWMAQIDAKTSQAVNCATTRPVDCFMTSFGECHDVGHTLWHLHDDSHPDFDRELANQLGDPVRKIYRALDDALSTILQEVPADHVIVFAGPGMGPNYTANSALRALLADLQENMYGSAGTNESSRKSVRRSARSLVPSGLRRILRKLGPTGVIDRWDSEDMSRHHFFRMPHTAMSGAVRINLRGREPAGRINPGDDYRALCDELSERLSQIVNAETGGPAVSKVVRVHEHCHGAALDKLPDLLVVWNREAPLRHIRLAGVGEYPVAQPGRRGDHTENAMMLISGPGIAAGRTLRAASVTDIAPTITHLLGRTPAGYDGVPIEFA